MEPGSKLRERYDRAWDTARSAARLLKESYEARRVVVFGSLASESRFTKWSDIDLAAWGIPYDKFFRAVAAVNDLGGEFSVDLVDPVKLEGWSSDDSQERG
jgi:predicted nucleotidyltransferase